METGVCFRRMEPTFRATICVTLQRPGVQLNTGHLVLYRRFTGLELLGDGKGMPSERNELVVVDGSLTGGPHCRNLGCGCQPEPSARSGDRGIPRAGSLTATSRLFMVLSVHLISLRVCSAPQQTNTIYFVEFRLGGNCNNRIWVCRES